MSQVAFRIGDFLVYLCPDMDTSLSLHEDDIPDYFAVIESLVEYGRIDLANPQKWKSLTNKMICNDAMKTVPLP